MITIFGLKRRIVNDCKVYFGNEIFKEIDETNDTCDVVLNRYTTVIYSGEIVTIDFHDLTFCIEISDFHYMAIS